METIKELKLIIAQLNDREKEIKERQKKYYKYVTKGYTPRPKLLTNDINKYNRDRYQTNKEIKSLLMIGLN